MQDSNSKAGIPEALKSGDLKVSSLGKGPEVADLKKLETSVFDPKKSKFVEALRLMLLLFNEGTSAEEITVLFRSHNRYLRLSFVGDVIGKIKNVERGELSDSQQLEDKHRVNLDIAIFELLLQSDLNSITLIQKEFENNDYYLRKAFIQEMLFNQDEWESETLRQKGSHIHNVHTKRALHTKRPRKQ